MNSELLPGRISLSKTNISKVFWPFFLNQFSDSNSNRWSCRFFLKSNSDFLLCAQLLQIRFENAFLETRKMAKVFFYVGIYKTHVHNDVCVYIYYCKYKCMTEEEELTPVVHVRVCSCVCPLSV